MQIDISNHLQIIFLNILLKLHHSTSVINLLKWPGILKTQNISKLKKSKKAFQYLSLVQLSIHFSQNTLLPLYDICFSWHLKETACFDTVAFYQMYLNLLTDTKVTWGNYKSAYQVSFVSLSNHRVSTDQHNFLFIVKHATQLAFSKLFLPRDCRSHFVYLQL